VGKEVDRVLLYWQAKETREMEEGLVLFIYHGCWSY